MAARRITAGAPEPLGVTPTATGVNVAVVSTTAAAIDVCLFDGDQEQRFRLPERTGEVFHGHIEGVGVGDRYGLRAHGAFAPARGHRFDPSKLLVDPLAQQLDAVLRLHPALSSAPEAGEDSAPHVPKAIVTAPAAPAAPALLHPWEGTVIYEAHVRGLTKLHPEVPEPLRGTFAGLAHPALIDHLKRLGVTTLELLPTAAWIDERHLGPLGLTNYWGYNPIALCAPDPRLAPGGWSEIRTAVETLAEAGIEVILDVVYNHTGESDELGPTVSLRGLDNAGYYRLNPTDPALYVNDAGTGNILACDRLPVVRLIVEAMRTWARRARVAGFRFDLGAVLGRRTDGFDANAALFAALDADPELRALKLIAEPWDCGPGGYQLGRFPSRWAEWNDRGRDSLRRFWGGGGASLGELAGVLAGSQNVFGPKGRPSRGINFVSAHDGFTLADLTSYVERRNEANGEHNRDGHSHNLSWNHGVEGPSADAEVTARRSADQRALLALLLAARGTPMLAAGSELGHSQGGNNNAYAQDNETSWIDWAGADDTLRAFTARLVGARREHPAVHADRFFTGDTSEGPLPDVDWRRADGAPLEPRDWDDPAGPGLAMVLAGKSDRCAVLINRGDAAASFALPEPRDGFAWGLVADSGDPARAETIDSERLQVGGRSVAWVSEAAAPGRRPQATDEAVSDLAQAAGIAPDWYTLDGARTAVSLDTKRALLGAMDLPCATPDAVRESRWRLGAPLRARVPGCQIAYEHEPMSVRVRGETWLTLEAEDARIRHVPVEDGVARLPPLALGRYRMRAGEAQGVLIVAPRRAHEPERLAAGQRIFGVSAQLYSLRRRGDAGIGDFTALGMLGDLARDAGAEMIALNPLHALFPQERERASPYYPSDRRFLEPFYLDAGRAGAGGGGVIDYPAMWRARAGALDQAAASVDPGELEVFVREGGQPLADFCTYQAIADVHGGAWSGWPEPLRDPRSAAVAAFVAANAEAVRRHQALQFLCDRQLAAAAAQAPGLGFCRDLAVGAAPDGAEAWANQGLLASNVAIGAPPDAFAPQGQVWGLPPPDPHRWRADAYASFSGLLSANMRHAGALRIDHILGLARLFWVPAGAEGRDGAYVAYPRDELLAVLALESRRANCLVIGEDLGTVPEGLRDALSDAGVYRYCVVPFERDGERFRSPSAYPQRALACASTHDLPPLEGWWEGLDIKERETLGLVGPEETQTAQAGRRAEKQALLEAMAAEGLWPAERLTPDIPFDDGLAAALHAFAARAESRILLVQIDDLAGETVGVNLPGTDHERPNWRRRLKADLEDLPAQPRWRAILDAVRAERMP